MTKDNHNLGKFDLTGIPPAPKGVPQIEVTFEIDENSILKVSAVDKGTGKSEKIVITNDKGRLSKEDIERMVKEAEQFADQDKKVKEKIDAKNSLENYVYSMKNTVEDKEKLGSKIGEEDKNVILNAVKEHQEWLNANQEAEKEDYETHLKELQTTCDPIVAKLYKEHGGPTGGNPQGGAETEEPTSEL